MKTLIIAEAGVNHNGDINLAKKLVTVAAEAGADVIKFQTFTADNLVTKGAHKAHYQTLTTNSSESQHAMIHNLELSHSMHQELIDYCAKYEIEFLSSGFDIKSVNLLIKLGLSRFKIPSGEITNLPYLRHIGAQGKEIILSTGMANLEEIRDAIEILESAGASRNKITVLHCNTDYPTPLIDVNLRAMITIKNVFDVKIGYSDHTLGSDVAIAAVSMGATIIEKHITLDAKMPGPDHKASMEPQQFKDMVAAIRGIELAMGDGFKKPSPSELKNIQIVRKSLVAACLINEGEIFNSLNIAVKRPGTGISPMLWDEVIGKKAIKKFMPDDLIEI